MTRKAVHLVFCEGSQVDMSIKNNLWNINIIFFFSAQIQRKKISSKTGKLLLVPFIRITSYKGTFEGIFRLRRGHIHIQNGHFNTNFKVHFCYIFPLHYTVLYTSRNHFPYYFAMKRLFALGRRPVGSRIRTGDLI
jgi:hypothetical protein